MSVRLQEQVADAAGRNAVRGVWATVQSRKWKWLPDGLRKLLSSAHHRLASYYPGTRWHTRRLRKQITGAAEKRRKGLHILDTLGLGADRVIRSSLRHHQNHLAAVETWEVEISRLSLFFVLFFVIITLPVQLQPYIHHLHLAPPSRSKLNVVGQTIAFVILFLFVGMGIAVRSFVKTMARHEYLIVSSRLAPRLMVGLLTWFLIALLYLEPPGMSDLHDLVVNLELVGVALWLFFPILLSGLTTTLLFRRWRRWTYPDAVISDHMLQVLQILESPGEWRSLAKRTEALKHLEDAAFAVEFGLPQRLRAADPVSDLWLRQRALRVAAAIRELKRWVSIPKPDTRTVLVARLKDNLASIARGDLDQLPEADPEKLPKRIRAMTIVRDSVVAVLPITSLFLLHRWIPSIFDPTALNWLYAAFIIWAVAKLMAILDPRLTLEAVKSIADLVPWWPKSKG